MGHRTSEYDPGKAIPNAGNYFGNPFGRSHRKHAVDHWLLDGNLEHAARSMLPQLF